MTQLLPIIALLFGVALVVRGIRAPRQSTDQRLALVTGCVLVSVGMLGLSPLPAPLVYAIVGAGTVIAVIRLFGGH